MNTDRGRGMFGVGGWEDTLVQEKVRKISEAGGRAPRPVRASSFH